MTRLVKKDATNVSVELLIVDSTDGTPETGVVWNTAGIDLNYRRDGAAVVSITEATLSALTDAHSDGGFLHVANGRYRLDVPDAAFATGVSQVTIGGTVTGMVVLPVTIQLVDFDPDDATRLGLTALPNATAGGSGINATNSITSTVLADNAVNSSVLADDAITAAKIAADAIGSSELASTAVDKITAALAFGVYDSSLHGLDILANYASGAEVAAESVANGFVLVDTTIATLASQTSFTLTQGSTDDSAYVNCTAVIQDVSTSDQKAVGLVSAYTGATKTVTLKYDPGIFTMAATDNIRIIADNSLKSTDQNRQLDVTATGAAGIDWGNVENPTTAVDLSATDIQLCDTITTYTGNTVQTGDAFARLGAPAGASMSADVAAVKVDTAAILVDTADMQPKLGTPAGADMSADIAAVKVDTAAIITDLADGTVVVGTINDGAIGAAAVADIFSTTTIAEDYHANGVDGTPAQLLWFILQTLQDFGVSGTTLTVRKQDASPAGTFTLDDGTSPTDISRTT